MQTHHKFTLMSNYTQCWEAGIANLLYRNGRQILFMQLRSVAV